MVRPLRPDYTNTYHHVVIRGVDGLPIFNSKKKRNTFLQIFRETLESHDLRIFAFGFLNNHWHGFVQRVNLKMARFFQTVKSRYTVWYNDENNRRGTLYDGRYHSSIVEAEEYFQRVWLYVQSQGVKAGLYKSREEDPGSTASFYAGLNDDYDWIDWQEALRTLDVPTETIGESFTQLTRQEDIPDELPVQRQRDQNFIASDDYIEKFMQIRKKKVRTSNRDESPLSWEKLLSGLEILFKVDPETLLVKTKERTKNRLRAGLVYAARKYGHKTTNEIANKLNVSDTTVSRMNRKAVEQYSRIKQQWDDWIETGNRGV